MVVDDESVLTRPSRELDDVVRWGPRDDDVADVRHGDPEMPLIVLIHGGFWRPAYDRVHVRATTEALADEGFTVAAPEYRRIPGEPDLLVSDVAVALRELPGLLAGRHDGRVIVMGHSAGGHLALWQAVVAPPPGLVLTVALGAVGDLVLAEREDLGDGAVRAFLGGPAADRPDLDPAQLPSPATPVTLVHGLDDPIVPVGQARAYADVTPEAELVELYDAGHFAVIDPWSDVWADVVTAVRAGM